MAEPWAPTLEEVADYVPTRTIPTIGVGEQQPLGTFDTTTTPTGAHAQRIIDRAVSWVLARTGAVAESAQGAAKDVAALRAAGLVELAYPDRDADVNTATALLGQADAALDDLVAANLSAGGGSGSDAQPLALHSFPAPHPYGDIPWI